MLGAGLLKADDSGFTFPGYEIVLTIFSVKVWMNCVIYENCISPGSGELNFYPANSSGVE